jgi:four helix bundle protein
LLVWQKAVSLAGKIYRTTQTFPNPDRHVLSVQMRRAALSVPSNIAEGAARNSRAEYLRFLNIARGSLSELETQVDVTVQLGLVDASANLEEDLAEVGRLLSALHRRLREHRERSRGFERATATSGH